MDNINSFFTGIYPQILDWMSNQGAILLTIMVGTWLVLLIARRLIKRWSKMLIGRAEHRHRSEGKKRIQTLSQLSLNVVTVSLLILAAIMLLSQLGINVGPLLAAAGVLGIAIGFGTQSLVKDVITGLFLLVENQFNVGDVISVVGVAGIVEKSTLRVTVLRDLEGKVHFVPNGQINVASNLTKEWSRAVIDIAVAYKENVDRVMAHLLKLGEELSRDPEWTQRLIGPMEVLGVDHFADSAVVIKVMFTTLPLKQWEVGREYRRRVKNHFDREGIEIPFPHRTLYFKDSQQLQRAMGQDGRQL
jgi:small-conductance mechanosensitive channel